MKVLMASVSWRTEANEPGREVTAEKHSVNRAAQGAERPFRSDYHAALTRRNSRTAGRGRHSATSSREVPAHRSP